MEISAERNPAGRVELIDALRGFAIFLMVLDHTRTFFFVLPYHPLDVTQSTPPAFFLRWVTHLAAPIFVFLTGISARLQRERYDLSSYEFMRRQILRGFWLIFAEISWLHFIWTFRLNWEPVTLQVIFAIGCGLVVLGLLSRVSDHAILVAGVLILLLHNLTDFYSYNASIPWWWRLLHVYGEFRATGNVLVRVAYPVLPWIGLLLLGYGGAHELLRRKPAGPGSAMPSAWLFSGQLIYRSVILWGGIGFILLLLRCSDPLSHMRELHATIHSVGPIQIMIRYGNFYIWQTHPEVGKTVMSFLNMCKYPPSLVFLLMCVFFTMPIVWLLARYSGLGITRMLMLVGRVPFFAYFVHLLLLHVLALVYFRLLGAGWQPDPHFYRDGMSSYSPPLLLLPLIASLFFYIIYILSRQYARYRSHMPAWMRLML